MHIRTVGIFPLFDARHNFALFLQRVGWPIVRSPFGGDRVVPAMPPGAEEKPVRFSRLRGGIQGRFMLLIPCSGFLAVLPDVAIFCCPQTFCSPHIRVLCKQKGRLHFGPSEASHAAALQGCSSPGAGQRLMAILPPSSRGHSYRYFIEDLSRLS